MTQAQILDKTVCISNNADNLEKGMSPPAMSKIVGQTGLFSLGVATNLKNEN